MCKFVVLECVFMYMYVCTCVQIDLVPMKNTCYDSRTCAHAHKLNMINTRVHMHTNSRVCRMFGQRQAWHWVLPRCMLEGLTST